MYFHPPNISLWVTDGHITKSEPTWYRIVAEAPPACTQFLLFQERTVGTSAVVQWLRIHLLMQSTWVWVLLGKPGGSDSKESACNAGDLGSIPGSGRSLEKGLSTYSSILAWGIPWTEEPGGLQSMGSQRVGQGWVTNTHTGNQDPACLREAKPVSFNNGAHTLLGPCSTIREARELQWRPSTAKKQREGTLNVFSLYPVVAAGLWGFHVVTLLTRQQCSELTRSRR